jgi:hypothetical protein
MPEPVATVDADGFLVVLSSSYIPTHATLFTADQVRQVMLDATERAAKKCDALQDLSEEKKALGKFQAAEHLSTQEALSRGNHWSTVNLFNTALRRAAAAIRGDGGHHGKT